MIPHWGFDVLHDGHYEDLAVGIRMDALLGWVNMGRGQATDQHNFEI